MEHGTHISNYISSTMKIMARGLQITERPIAKLKEFDWLLNQNQIVTILGDCGSGRSSLTIKMVDNLSIDKQIPTLYLCVRGSMSEFIDRLIDFRCPKNSYEANRESVIKEIGKSPIYLYSKCLMDIDDVCDVCMEHVLSYGIKVLFLHFEYVNYKMDNAFQLRALAKRLGITIVIIASIWELRDGIYDKYPRLSDLCDSRLNEYSDTVIGLFNYSANDILIDDEGNDVKDLLHVNILKLYGKLENINFQINKSSLRCKTGY